MRIEVDVAQSGEILRFAVAVRALGGVGGVGLTYRFTNWDAPVQLAAPGPDEIDLAPGIDEEKVASFSDVPTLQPRGVPERWTLVDADVVPGAQTAEGCRQVTLEYAHVRSRDDGFLTLYEFPATCLPGLPRRAVAFSAGGADGHTVLTPGVGITGAITAGRTSIRFESNLTADDLAVVLSDLVPLDLEVAPLGLGGVGLNLVSSSR